MTLRTRSSAALLFLCSVFGAPPVFGAESASRGIVHRISDRGESYEDLADFYYGKRWFSLHLRAFNGRSEPLPKGTSIIIPTYGLVAVKRGQSLAQFAEQNLSDPGRADYLAELHGLRARERQAPKPGMRLRVVESLKHVVRPGETLKSIARVYYRDVSSERLRLIILYNKLSSGNVKSGMALRIPLDTTEFSRDMVMLRGRKPFERTEGQAQAQAQPQPEAPKEAAEKSGEKSEKSEKAEKTERPEKRTHEPPAPRRRPKRESAVAQKEKSEEDDLPKGDSPAPEIDHPAQTAAAAAQPRKLDDDLEDVERLCSDGEYKECEELARRTIQNAPQGAIAGRVEVLRLRAEALVALGRVEESKSAFKQLLKLDPDYDLDLYRTSPKVLDVFQAVAER